MFGMAELQQRIGGRSVSDDAMEALPECYPLIYSAAFLCNTSPAFSEIVDDDEPTSYQAMGEEEENNALDEANALMMFDRGDDESQRPQGVFLPFYIDFLMN